MKRIIGIALVAVAVFLGIQSGWFEKLANNSPSSAAPSCTWSLPALAAQVVVVPVDGSRIATAAPAVAAGAGGVILFGTMPKDLDAQLASLVGHAPKGSAPFIMADQEGGRVQRLSGVIDGLNSARWMADHWSADEIKGRGTWVGEQMKKLGVTMDLAPVLDLDDRPNSTTNPDGDRSFSLDATKTSQDGVAFAQGLQAAGVAPVVKHFPGLGYASGNTDLQAAHTVPWSQLQGAGLLPFKAAIDAGVPAVMTSDAGVPGLTNLPASLSPEVTDVLRKQLGFKGIIMTDTLSAVAISANGFTPESAAVAAIKAGADMILYGTPSTPATEYDKMTAAIVDAVNKGQLSRDTLVAAATTVLAAKHSSCG